MSVTPKPITVTSGEAEALLADYRRWNKDVLILRVEVAPRDRWMTLQEAATYLRKSEETVYKLRKEGRFCRGYKEGKHVYFKQSMLDEWREQFIDDERGLPDVIKSAPSPALAGLISARAVARRLRLPNVALEQMITAGELPPYVVVEGQKRWNKDEFMAWYAKQPEEVRTGRYL